MKDAFIRTQIPLTKIHGQCNDGCSTMAGAKSDVATRIQELQPRTVFLHCYGHALNLTMSDTVKAVSCDEGLARHTLRNC